MIPAFFIIAIFELPSRGTANLFLERCCDEEDIVEDAVEEADEDLDDGLWLLLEEVSFCGDVTIVGDVGVVLVFLLMLLLMTIFSSSVPLLSRIRTLIVDVGA